MQLVLTVVSPRRDTPTGDPQPAGSTTGTAVDVVLDVRPETTIGALAEGVARVGAGTPPEADPFADRLPDPLAEVADCYLGERRLDPFVTVRECGLVAGARLGLGAPVPTEDDRWSRGTEPRRWLEVHAVGGPDSGRIWPVGLGVHPIGSAAGAAIRLVGPGVPDRGLRLSVAYSGDAWLGGENLAAGRLAQPAPPRRGGDQDGGGHGTVGPGDGDDASGNEHDEPERRPARATRAWPVGVDLAVGDGLLRLVERSEPDGAVTPAEDIIGRDFNRPPRIVPPLLYSRQRLPAPPRPPGRRPIPLVMILSPMVMGLAFVWFFHSAFFLIIMIFSPLLGTANWYNDRRTGRRRYREDTALYQVRRTQADRELFATVSAERVARCAAAPDPATVGLIAAGPGGRLWERRRSDPDFLVLRVGTVDQPSLIEVEDPAREEHQRQLRWNVPDLPLGLDVVGRGVVGVVGDDGTARAVTRWLVAQAAALHSPRDLRVEVLTDRAGQSCWDWVGWLPHARPAGLVGSVGGAAPYALVGNDPETVAHRVSELLAIVKARIRARGSSMGTVVFAEPDVLVVVDGARRLRDVPGMVQVLKDGPAVRVFALCLDTQERLLPEECTAVVRCDLDGLTVRQTDTPELAGVRPDAVSPVWCDRVARGMSPLRDVTPDEAGGLPDQVRLLELLGLDGQRPPDPALVAGGWQRQPASTRFPIGMGFDGPVRLDLVRDGPHSLIAGTTGAGKSELLQSLVVALAAMNRPDELVFVLVDYKGGSAFHTCVDLPHTLGMVTDLDSALAIRALESLGAELRRREEVLASARAKDLPHYRSLRAAGGDLPALPRLVLIIDEFASLVREVPDFIPGLVSLAQRGRSLGIHLVLATQRPAGVVTGDIRANTNLRIALRVTDPIESSDVIDTQDAAFISAANPGRALARLAHRSSVPFQTAYVGAPYPGPDSDSSAEADHGSRSDGRGSDGGGLGSSGSDGRGPGRDEPGPVEAAELPWSGLGRPLPFPVPGAAGGGTTDAAGPPDKPAATDLDVLVETIRAAAEFVGHQPQPSPWLPPLGPHVLLADLLVRTGRPRAPGPSGRLAPVPYALEDRPGQQAQAPVLCDLATFGHLYVVGTPRSGRSQVLRTLAGALAGAHSCADVHLYGVDAGGGALAVLTDLPHCGAVVPSSDLERLGRLLDRLAEELNHRQSLLARHSCAGLDELRAALPAPDRPAHLLLMIDGWDSVAAALTDHNGGGLYEGLLALLREGAGVGIHLVLTSERGLLSGRAGGLSDHRLLLRMGDRGDYSAIRVPAQRIPEVVPPGRGWRSVNQAEVQIALLDADASGPGQAGALRRVAARSRARDSGVPATRLPFPVGALPATVTFADAFASVPDEDHRPLRALLGLGGNAVAPVAVDFAARSHSFLVAGPPGSGRSNTLATLAVSLLAAGTRLVVVTPRDSPLRKLGAHTDVHLVTGPSPAPAEVADAVAAGGPVVVLVDDIDLLGFVGPLDGPLREIVATGRDRGVGLAYAGTADMMSQTLSGWIGEAKRSRQGVLLAPQSALEGDLLGTRIPPSLLRAGVQPGRGYLVDATGKLRAVAIPHTVLL